MKEKYVIKITQAQDNTDGVHGEYFELRLVQALGALPKPKSIRWKVNVLAIIGETTTGEPVHGPPNKKAKTINLIELSSVAPRTKGVLYNNETVVDEVRSVIRKANWKRLNAELECIVP